MPLVIFMIGTCFGSFISCMSRQCLRDGAKALILLGFLDRNVKFTPYLHLWKIGSE